MDRKLIRVLAQASMAGAMMGACIVVGTLMGYGLDLWLGTRPWLTLVFMVFGIIAGFYNAIRIISALRTWDKPK